MSSKRPKLTNQIKLQLTLIDMLGISEISEEANEYKKNHNIPEKELAKWKKIFSDSAFNNHKNSNKTPHMNSTSDASQLIKQQNDFLEKLISSDALNKIPPPKNRLSTLIHLVLSVILAFFTAKLAFITEDMLDSTLKPEILATLTIETPSTKTTCKESYIEFSVAELLDYRDEIEFYIDIINNWEKPINQNIELFFSIERIDEQNRKKDIKTMKLTYPIEKQDQLYAFEPKVNWLREKITKDADFIPKDVHHSDKIRIYISRKESKINGHPYAKIKPTYRLIPRKGLPNNENEKNT